MERNSILLAGGLTAVLVAVVVVVGRANGAFGGGPQAGDVQQAFAAETPVGQSVTAAPRDNVMYVYPDGSPAPDPNQPVANAPQRQVGEGTDPSGQGGITYVYADGSSAPDPNSPEAARGSSNRHGDDDEDDEDQDEEHEEREHEGRGLERLFKTERDD